MGVLNSNKVLPQTKTISVKNAKLSKGFVTGLDNINVKGYSTMFVHVKTSAKNMRLSVIGGETESGWVTSATTFVQIGQSGKVLSNTIIEKGYYICDVANVNFCAVSNIGEAMSEVVDVDVILSPLTIDTSYYTLPTLRGEYNISHLTKNVEIKGNGQLPLFYIDIDYSLYKTMKLEVTLSKEDSEISISLPTHDTADSTAYPLISNNIGEVFHHIARSGVYYVDMSYFDVDKAIVLSVINNKNVTGSVKATLLKNKVDIPVKSTQEVYNGKFEIESAGTKIPSFEERSIMRLFRYFQINVTFLNALGEPTYVGAFTLRCDWFRAGLYREQPIYMYTNIAENLSDIKIFRSEWLKAMGVAPYFYVQVGEQRECTHYEISVIGIR